MRRRKAYDFHVHREGAEYVIRWTIDMKIRGKWRTMTCRQFTDEAGAKRFCKKHKIDFEKIEGGK